MANGNGKNGKMSCTLRFKVTVLDIKAGQNEIAISESDASCLGLDLLDRCKVSSNGLDEIAIVDFSRGFVKSGEVELFWEIAEKLKVKTGDYVAISSSPKPA